VSVPLYADHHVPAPITEGVRLRGVNVLTTEEDGTQRLADPALLDRATELGRVLLTQDRTFSSKRAAPTVRDSFCWSYLRPAGFGAYR